ncbi:Mrx10p SKDI_04G4930 [Saccharomyces kudriavzevii IFO 1802]|uniref:Uncharacterized protein n=2 Tax=Saccharomyces kudriavzevii (strain ATCC MYA-4449 / AS 2.2408 / CBS 8840 / NBRC 1802 / NCYC 2889) TaxID=226230 RepID=A0AA35NP56_SACK1|nr:uncharacterized protein SKDI_04G4930 [Saccharomyces kudriavzevii IFO 1802]EJT42223.1 YDR282C-like protein [Saccharomyces kudriavzevii IFO 1802]CAI4058758.1 hypothetical protein SKDI_04G4930 [Saccharomyces kudriavzevii IFO 1802]
MFSLRGLPNSFCFVSKSQIRWIGTSLAVQNLKVRDDRWKDKLAAENKIDKGSKPMDTKIKTMKTLKNSKNSTRYLRRSFVPNHGTKENGYDNLEDVFNKKCLKVKNCTTITTGEGYNLKECMRLLNSKGLKPTGLVTDEIVTFSYQDNGTKGDLMILGQNGSIVGWGFGESTVRNKIVPLVKAASINPLSEEDFETEDMDYVELEKKKDLEKLFSGNKNVTLKTVDQSFLSGDLILINSLDSDQGMLDKAAFSSGLSRSTNLAVLEEAMERHISKTRTITENISKGTTLKLKSSDALKSIGRLFLIRGKLNLYSELIETPDLYWSEPQLELIFKNVSRYLDIVPRINILNSKLDYSTDECRALISLLNERKGTFLEWIIIYLIAFELCFELFHLYQRYSPQSLEPTNDDPSAD